MPLPEIVEKVCVSIACTIAVALGAAVIHGERSNSVQDVHIEDLQRTENQTSETLDRLDQSVRSLDKNVAVLTERLANGKRKSDR